MKIPAYWSTLRLLTLALVALASLAPAPAKAQTVVQLPAYIDNSGVVYDFGNGPLEFIILGGNAGFFTASGSGVGSVAAGTALVLTASAAANPPCVGCLISGTGITPGTTVAAFNGTTGITLSASMTVTAATVSWGMACPATGAGQKLALLQPGQPPVSGLPFYTQARICGVAQYNVGATVIPFAIGAH